MRRREFITLIGGAAAHGRSWRARSNLRYLWSGFYTVAIRQFLPTPWRSSAEALKKQGYIEGQSLRVEYRWAEGRYIVCRHWPTDLTDHHVAVIVSRRGNGPAAAAKAATPTIPIVFISGDDPVEAGLVASLDRPGGNVTGVAFFNSALGRESGWSCCMS